MSWTDEEIDQLFRDRASDLSFDYKPEFWDEFSSSLSSVDLGGMSGDHHEIDQLYQLSANEFTFAYKDAYWKEVEGMLPRRRRPDFLWLGTAVIFLGALTVGSVYNQATNQGSPLHTEVSAEPVEGTQLEANNSSVDKHNAQVVNEPLLGNTQDDLNLGNEPGENATQHPGNDPQTVNNPGLNPGGNTPVDVNTPPPSNIIVENPVDPGLNIVPSLTPNEENLLTEQNDPNAPVENVNPNEPGVETSEKRDIDRLPTRELPGLDAQVLAVSDLPAVYDFKLPLISALYVEMNGGLSQSLITPSSSFSYSGGLGLGMRFQKGRFNFNVGVNGQMSFHDDLILNRVAKVYSFGSDVYRYTLKYNQFYTVEGLLSAGYRFGAHQIYLGLRPSYLIGTKVGVTLMEEDVESDRQTVYGHTEGLKRFGLKPTIGYSVDLPSNFTLGLNVGVQTLKQVDEEFINGKNNTLPLDMQIYLRKNLRFRK